MKVQDLKVYIESKVSYSYVLNAFHSDTQDSCCAVILGSSGKTRKTIGQLQFQFLVRSKDMELAETVAFQLYDHFNNKTDFVIGETKIVLTQGQQAVPIYTGMDEKYRHIYSVNVNVIADVE